MKPLPGLPKPGTIADVRQSMKAAPALPAVEDGIGKFFGIWPGDETDEQFLAAIDEIRKPPDAEKLAAALKLLKEYREWMKNADGCNIYYGVVPNGSDQRCSTCIKTDLLLKENK